MGLIILAILVTYLGLLCYLIYVAVTGKSLCKRITAAAIALLMVLVPFGDIPLDKHRFDKLCEEQGGIFVYHRVGLPKEYFLTPGEPVRKLFVDPDGGKHNRLVPASGNELNMEKLKERFKIYDYSDRDYVSWGKVVKFTTDIRDGDALLSRAVSFIGGAGWLIEKINWSPRIPRKRCPSYEREPDRPSYRERLYYQTFYKSQD